MGTATTRAPPSKLYTLLGEGGEDIPKCLGDPKPHFCTKQPPRLKEVSFKKLYKNDVTSAMVLVVLCVCPLAPGPVVSELPQDWYPQIIPKHQASLTPSDITKDWG